MYEYGSLIRSWRKNGDTSALEILREENMLHLNSKRTFGVELEVIFPSRAEYDMFFASLERKGIDIVSLGYTHEDFPSTWKAVPDSSINCKSSQFPIEIVSPILRGRSGMQALKRVVEELNSFGAFTNESCGLHVHIGAQDLTFPKFRRIFELYALHQEEFSNLCSSDRRFNFDFCRPLQICDLAKFDSACSIHSLARNYSRYSAVNFNAYDRHGTIEFRQFQGSCDWEEIRHWVEVVLAFSVWAKVGPSEDVQFFDGLELSKESIRFWKRKAESYATSYSF